MFLRPSLHIIFLLILIMSKFLTKEQKNQLLRELRLEDKARYSDRIKVILLLDKGWTYQKISEALFIDESTIANYRRRYKDGGLEQLINDFHNGKKSFLSDEDSLELQSYLIENLYETTIEICSYVFKKYKVEYSISGMTKLLHRLNFTFKKTKGIPGKAKKSLQEVFVKKIENITNENLPIYFADATHPTHVTELSSGWILKGTEKDILTSSGRKRLNIFGALSIEKMDVMAKFYETINQDSICDFLFTLREKSNSDEKIYLILDRGPANRAASVIGIAYLLNIEIIYLPAYSPNLNPIERLWKFFKKKALKNKYFEKYLDFKKSCHDFFNNIEKYKKDLISLLNYNFNILGT